jgi:hypothetical protein
VLEKFGEINPIHPGYGWRQLADTIEVIVSDWSSIEDPRERRVQELRLFTLIWTMVIQIGQGPTIPELYRTLVKAETDAALARKSMNDSQELKDILVFLLCLFPLNEGLRLFYQINPTSSNSASEWQWLTEADRLSIEEVNKLTGVYDSLQVLNGT